MDDGPSARMQATDDVAELLDADMAFHSVIAQAAGNTVLSALLDGLAARTMRARLWRGQADHAVLADTLAEHVRIFEAVTSGDPELARALAAAHIATGELWLRLHLGDDATDR